MLCIRFIALSLFRVIQRQTRPNPFQSSPAALYRQPKSGAGKPTIPKLARDCKLSPCIVFIS